MMAFAYGYFNNFAQVEMEASLTYENMISHEDLWTRKETVWVLGKKFQLPHERDSFLKFVRSKVWCTYRKGFSPIGGTGPTSDSGWGCMLRCGQMMLAQAFSVFTLSKDWKWHPNIEKQPLSYKKILSQLSDIRSSCYSIHQISQMGVSEGKEVGQWFGPNTIAQVLKRLSQFDQENFLAFHVAMDNTVCIEEIERKCCLKTNDSHAVYPANDFMKADEASCSSCATSVNMRTPHSAVTCDATTVSPGSSEINGNSEFFWKPLFLIIPLRLGLSEINPVYFKHLKEILKWKESVGVIGGKPNHAYYFVGCSDSDSLVYLDPHTTQPFVKFPNWDTDEKFNDGSYHCDCPSKMSLSLLDPSLALGFVCSTREEFSRFCQRARSFEKTSTSLPMFEVIQSFPQCNIKESQILTLKSHSRQKRKEKDEDKSMYDDACIALDADESVDSDEEFEVLEID